MPITGWQFHAGSTSFTGWKFWKLLVLFGKCFMKNLLNDNNKSHNVGGNWYLQSFSKTDSVFRFIVCLLIRIFRQYLFYNSAYVYLSSVTCWTIYIKRVLFTFGPRPVVLHFCCIAQSNIKDFSILWVYSFISL